MNRGYTLLEVLVVVSMIGTFVSIIGGPAGGLRDSLAARAVVEDVVAVVRSARAEGRARGGSLLWLHDDGRYSIHGPDGVVRRGAVALNRARALELSAGRDSVALRFDRLGLGRMASTTVRIRAGNEERSVVVSAYGRVRRR